MEATYRELVPFLHDKNPAVRNLALQTLLEQTPKDSPFRKIFLEGLSGGGLKATKEPLIFRDLKLLCRDQPDIAHGAFKALVNLSDNSIVVPTLSDLPFMNFLTSYIINPSSVMAELASMLLSNLTAHSTPCNTLFSMTIHVSEHSTLPGGFYAVGSRCSTAPPPSIPADARKRELTALPLLLDAFVDGAATDMSLTQDKTPRRKAKLHFLASVFANFSTIPAGRLFFLTPRPPSPLQDRTAGLEYPLSKLTPFTEHSDLIRRGGVASTIKYSSILMTPFIKLEVDTSECRNCCFHQPAHKAILSLETLTVDVPPSTDAAPGINITLAILQPLAGPEEFDLEDTELLPAPLQFLPDTKKREPDPALRAIHLESLVLLCTTRWGREQLRQYGVYLIIRELHKVETDAKVLQLCDKLVNLLKRDESAVVEEEEHHGTTKAPPPSSDSPADDSGDDIIQEI
ncbi:hypothetical protein FRB94_013056 [Tulasnella sp. JGI-2019a]|nr:hypothetical protein FRB94_013056 [Tulasnella sp. JGI-2019a]